MQFFHCSYQPQYISLKDGNETTQGDDYLALGEEWASTEALSQLGIVAKEKEGGRVLLDPTVSWVSGKLPSVTGQQTNVMVPLVNGAGDCNTNLAAQLHATMPEIHLNLL